MRAELFGVPLDLLTMEETVARCVEIIESERPAHHVSVNAGKIVMMRDVAGLQDIVAAAEMVSADGQSIVWAGRAAGIPVPERVAGIDLMTRLLAQAEIRAWPAYFLGARPDALEACVSKVMQRYPNLTIAGARDGYFDDATAAAAGVAASGARVLFVGISSPKKEQFLNEHLGSMGPVFALGVGGSFDVWAGLTSRAPRWMQRAGLEWAYRLAQEPQRLWRRYLVGNVRFAGLTLREVWRIRTGRTGR